MLNIQRCTLDQGAYGTIYKFFDNEIRAISRTMRFGGQ